MPLLAAWIVFICSPISSIGSGDAAAEVAAAAAAVLPRFSSACGAASLSPTKDISWFPYPLDSCATSVQVTARFLSPSASDPSRWVECASVCMCVGVCV